jgi:hypothetical protein
MRNRMVAGASLALALLVSSAWAADALQSGPQVGEGIPKPFQPENVTGKFAGKKQCLV